MKGIILFTFLNAISSFAYADCYKDSISSPTPFMGNNDEIFKLASGSVWQVKYEYEYLYAYYPNVIICPADGLLIINNKKLHIVNISSAPSSSQSSGDALIESRIDGDFNGWEGETIYKLMNGQVWQQASYYYWYYYQYSPKVTIFKNGGRYFMKVEGVDTPVPVVQLK